MAKKLDLLVECLRVDFGLETPRIAISGLNPHSGEQGQLGREEQDWLIPWLEQERHERPGVRLDGPVPPDTLWVKPAQAWYGEGKSFRQPGNSFYLNSPPYQGGEFQNLPDAYLALYHDQGLIPVKLMAFDRAINTTIGLPFVRTSPDHGTAFDIAGQGIANATSMKAAIQLAAELVNQRLTKKG
jgi:4-hydroxythreonine-4-phosphate dehydrogenase